MEISIEVLIVTIMILVPLTIIRFYRMISAKRRIARARETARTLQQRIRTQRAVEIEDEWIYDLQETKMFLKEYK